MAFRKYRKQIVDYGRGITMGNAEWMLAVVKENQMKALKETNVYTERFGLALTEEDAAILVSERMDALKRQGRVEFGEGILPQLILAFCDSAYLNQENYRDSLARLLDIFYEFKTEALEQLTDEELINFMREQFDDILKLFIPDFCVELENALGNECLDKILILT